MVEILLARPRKTRIEPHFWRAFACGDEVFFPLELYLPETNETGKPPTSMRFGHIQTPRSYLGSFLVSPGCVVPVARDGCRTKRK